MQMIKKWGSCAVSFLAGFLALVLGLILPGMVTSMDMMGVSETEKTKAMDILTDKDLLDGAKMYDLESEFSSMKTFSLILTIVAVLLIIYAVIVVLKKLDVIKFENKLFDYAGFALLALFLIAAIGVLITSLNYASEVTDVVSVAVEAMGGEASVKIGAYQPVMLVVSLLAAGGFGYLEYETIKGLLKK